MDKLMEFKRREEDEYPFQAAKRAAVWCEAEGRSGEGSPRSDGAENPSRPGGRARYSTHERRVYTRNESGTAEVILRLCLSFERQRRFSRQNK